MAPVGVRYVGNYLHASQQQCVVGDPQWTCEEQRLLALFLESFDRPMPRCRQVIGESGAKPVLAAARDAREEVMSALKSEQALDGDL